MIKQTVILLIVIFMLAALANAVYANAYLPIAISGGVHGAAIGYGEAITVKPRHWLDITCEDGKTPAARGNGSGGVIVMCED